MIMLTGRPSGISGEILGKVTRKRSVFRRVRDAVFVAGDDAYFPSGYAAVLTDKDVRPIKGATVAMVGGLSELHEGDVVAVDTNGNIRVLYDSCSEQHALLVTERCNHRCIMCPQPIEMQKHDGIAFNLKLISMFDRKPGNICLTGGEPTLIGDDLFVLIRAIWRRAPAASISVLTNGVRFADYDYARRLADIQHPDLQVEIPLYADTDIGHNRIVGAETFYQTIQGFFNLARLHQRIGLRVVIHRQTCGRLPQLAEFIYRNLPFVWHVMFMHLEPEGLAKKNIDSLWIDPSDCNPALQKAVLYLSRRNMRVSIYNAQLCVLPNMLRAFARQSISEWKRIYLPMCNGCRKKEICAGFFSSAVRCHSAHIVPF
jgi:His-Xaa-Ser system radical SAM maturase HxsC